MEAATSAEIAVGLAGVASGGSAGCVAAGANLLRTSNMNRPLLFSMLAAIEFCL